MTGLERYFRLVHRDGCGVNSTAGACTCGLDKALAHAEAIVGSAPATDASGVTELGSSDEQRPAKRKPPWGPGPL